MYESKTIFCPRCKKERWVGAKCPASNLDEPCVDQELENIKQRNKSFYRESNKGC